MSSIRPGHKKACLRRSWVLTAICVTATLLAACQRKAEEAAQAARPVRTLTVDKRAAGAPVVLTGRIEAEDEVALAFRISGRLLENELRMGDRVQPGQLLARLESQNELNALRAAQANLAAAQGQLTQARNHFERQDTLLKQGWTTRANHDQATQALQTAQAQVEAAEAQLKSARDLVSFTELKADAPGVLTATGPRAGEVVQAGQMIARIARQDGRDAVFEVPAQVIRSAPPDPEITVFLTEDPTARLIMGPIPGLSMANVGQIALVTIFGAVAFSMMGLYLGCVVAAQQIGLLFGIIVAPMIMFGCAYYPWRGLDMAPVVKYAVLANPLTYISEGLRGVLIPGLPHMPLPAVLGALTIITVVFWRLGLRAFMKRAVG